VRWVYEIPDPNAKEKLESVKSTFDMGIEFIEEQVRGLTGMGEPQPNDKIIGKRQQQQQDLAVEQQRAALGLPPPGMGDDPNGDGPPSKNGKPSSNGNGKHDDVPEFLKSKRFASEVELEHYAGFDPNEPRDENGEWTASGGQGDPRKKAARLDALLASGKEDPLPKAREAIATAKREAEWRLNIHQVSTSGKFGLFDNPGSARHSLQHLVGQYDTREEAESAWSDKHEQYVRPHKDNLKKLEKERDQLLAEERSNEPPPIEFGKKTAAPYTPDTARAFYDSVAFMTQDEFDKGLAGFDALKGKALAEVAAKLGIHGKITREKVKQFVSDRRGGSQRAKLTEPPGHKETPPVQAPAPESALRAEYELTQGPQGRTWDKAKKDFFEAGGTEKDFLETMDRLYGSSARLRKPATKEEPNVKPAIAGPSAGMGTSAGFLFQAELTRQALAADLQAAFPEPVELEPVVYVGEPLPPQNPAPVIHVHVPEIKIPDFKFPAPVVNFTAPEIRMPKIEMPDIKVNIPKAEPAVVTVNIPEIKMPGLPEIIVNIPEPKGTKKTIVRGKDGEIKEVIEMPEK
jgi:hypothetical protein